MENDALSTSTTEEMVTIPRAEYEGMKAQIDWLMEQLRLVRHRQFGSSSERISEEVMEEIGTEAKDALKIKPGEMYIQRDVYHTYACRSCEKNDVSAPVMKAPKEPPLIPGGFAFPEFVAHVAVQKFVMGSPLYRQEQEYKRQNIFLSRQTMSNWLIWCSENYLEHIYDVLHKELVKHDLLHADETELQVLHEPGKAPSRRAGCGCTGQVETHSTQSCCMSISRGGGRSTRRRTDTPGTTDWRM